MKKDWWKPVLVVFILVILTLAGLRFTLPQRDYESCQENLKNLATALEMYSTDNSRHYPEKLEQLVPGILKSIPTCPSAKRDTYSKGYKLSPDDHHWRISCKGNNHILAGIPSNLPGRNWTSLFTCRTGDIRDDIKFFRYNKIKNELKQNPSITDIKYEGGTLINTAAFHDFHEVIELLLKYKVDINETCSQGNTPLHTAAFMNYPDTVRELLKHGAKTHIKNKEGKTPLDIAKENKYKEIVKIIEEKK